MINIKKFAIPTRRLTQKGLALFIAAPAAVVPNIATSAQLEEVVVTAQKREQNIQDVPIAIQAFGGQLLQEKGLGNISEIAGLAPNVELDTTSAFSGSTQVLGAFIRGIGQSDFAFNLEPGVGVYVDGVYYSRAVGSVVDLLDLERVEILKGPQGSLFGRNTIGGALNVVTQRPGEEFDYRGEVTLGRFNRTDIKGTVDIPLIDGSLYSQVSFSSKSRDGYHKRIPFPESTVSDTGRFSGSGDEEFNAEQGDENNQTVRAKLLWTGDNVDFLLAADYSNVDEAAAPNTLLDTFELPIPETNGTLAQLYNGCIAGAPIPPCTLAGDRAVVGTTFFGVNVDADPANDRLPYDDRFITGDIDTSYGAGANFSKLESRGMAGTLDWSISDSLDLKSITAYREIETTFGGDIDGSPLAINDTSFYMAQEQISQEFQLLGSLFDGAVEWVLGAYYFHEEGDLDDYVVFGEGFVQILGPNEFDNDAYAVFGHASYQFTDDWALTMGIRYTREEKEFLGQQRDLNAFAGRTGFPAALHPDPNDLTLQFPGGVNTQDFSNVSPKVALDYHFSDSALVYASVSQGYKSGGWTTRATAPILEAPAFEEEEATSYELGLKLNGNSFRVNTALFFTDYENLQITVQRGLSPFFENAGESEIKGIEIDFEWLPTDNLSLSGAFGYIDAEYTFLEPGTALGLDFDFLNTPDTSANLSAKYTLPMKNGSVWDLLVDYSYHSDQANDAENTPLLYSGDLDTINAALTFRPFSENWSLTLGGKNLTDERYIVSGFRQPGAGVIDGNYSRPREWYLTFNFNK